MKRTFCLVALCLLLFACAPSRAQTKLPAQVYQRLLSYINTYNGDKLLADPAVRPQLVRRMGAQLSHLKTNLNVAGSIGVSSGMLTFSGNAPHRGTEEEGFLGVSLYDGQVYSVLLTNGRFEIYGNQANYDFLPDAVRQWILARWAAIKLNGKSPPDVVVHQKP